MSPLAKGIRTFAAAMVGVLGSVVVAAQASDWNTGLVALTVGVVAALIAGVISAVQSAADFMVADTPFKKAAATFFQFIAAGLATVVVADLGDVASVPRLLVPILVAAAAAGLQTFAQNSAEARPA